jgi:hypothetical protein
MIDKPFLTGFYQNKKKEGGLCSFRRRRFYGKNEGIVTYYL